MMSVYFCHPDGNLIEVSNYDEASLFQGFFSFECKWFVAINHILPFIGGGLYRYRFMLRKYPDSSKNRALRLYRYQMQSTALFLSNTVKHTQCFCGVLRHIQLVLHYYCDIIFFIVSPTILQ